MAQQFQCGVGLTVVSLPVAHVGSVFALVLFGSVMYRRAEQFAAGTTSLTGRGLSSNVSHTGIIVNSGNTKASARLFVIPCIIILLVIASALTWLFLLSYDMKLSAVEITERHGQRLVSFSIILAMFIAAYFLDVLAGKLSIYFERRNRSLHMRRTVREEAIKIHRPIEKEINEVPHGPCAAFVNEVQVPFMSRPRLNSYGLQISNLGYEGPHFHIQLRSEQLKALLGMRADKVIAKSVSDPELGYIDELQGRPACDFSTLRKIVSLKFWLTYEEGMTRFMFSGCAGEILERGISPKLPKYPAGYRFRVSFEVADADLRDFASDDLQYSILLEYISAVNRVCVANHSLKADHPDGRRP